MKYPLRENIKEFNKEFLTHSQSMFIHELADEVYAPTLRLQLNADPTLMKNSILTKLIFNYKGVWSQGNFVYGKDIINLYSEDNFDSAWNKL